MALFENYKKGDIYKNIPEPVNTLGREALGAVETAATIATSIPAQIGGWGRSVLQYPSGIIPDPTMLKEEKWLEKNKLKSTHPDYQRVLKDFKFRQSQIKTENEILGENIDSLTYIPRSEEGQRNLSVIGKKMRDWKIPPFTPGLGNIGRIGWKGKTPRVKKVKAKQPTTSAETLFIRAKMYFDKAKAAQVNFNNSYIIDVTNKMIAALKAGNISKISSYGSASNALILKIQNRAKSRKPININELFEFQDLIDDIVTTAKPKSKLAAGILRDELDDFIMFADEAAINKLSTGGRQNLDAFKRGQKYYHKAKNTNILEELINKAEMRMGASYTQAQLVDAMKKQVTTLVNSEKRSKYFTKYQKKILSDFAKGGKLEIFLKSMSKLDPTHGGWVIGATPGASTLVGSQFGAEAAGLTYLGLGSAGKVSAAVREAHMQKSINEMINKIQTRTVDVKPGYRQLDLQTDLGLLTLPKEDLVKKEKELQKRLMIKSLLNNELGFPQGKDFK